MTEIILSEHDIKTLINKGSIKILFKNEEVLIRQSFQKDLMADICHFDKQIVDTSKNVVMHKNYVSLLQSATH
ncbi:TPA: hypothetical protein VC364_000670 [Streptococcus pyogenes]|nr:hypothetical protein [Streptococcus pyogenes]